MTDQTSPAACPLKFVSRNNLLGYQITYPPSAAKLVERCGEMLGDNGSFVTVFEDHPDGMRQSVLAAPYYDFLRPGLNHLQKNGLVTHGDIARLERARDMVYGVVCAPN